MYSKADRTRLRQAQLKSMALFTSHNPYRLNFVNFSRPVPIAKDARGNRWYNSFAHEVDLAIKDLYE